LVDQEARGWVLVRLPIGVFHPFDQDGVIDPNVLCRFLGGGELIHRLVCSGEERVIVLGIYARSAFYGAC